MAENFWLFDSKQNPFTPAEWPDVDAAYRSALWWVPDYRDQLGDCLCLVTLNWPNDDVIHSVTKHETYVLTFLYEYPDLEWIKKFCMYHSTSRVILVSQVQWNDHNIANLLVLQQEFWSLALGHYKHLWPEPDFSLSRPKKISALANRSDQFRGIVCAFIHRHFAEQDRFISWRNRYHHRENFYFETTGRSKLDETIKYFDRDFFDLTIIPDSFFNSPQNNLRCDNPAYQDCMINCSNESVSRSWTVDDQGIGMREPGVYLSEKTWKPLLSGTALIPVGQAETYAWLESFGFEFDYPWSKDFDNIVQDLDRLDKILHVLDFVNGMDPLEIAAGIRSSCKHNYDHIVSGKFSQLSEEFNQRQVAIMVQKL